MQLSQELPFWQLEQLFKQVWQLPSERNLPLKHPGVQLEFFRRYPSPQAEQFVLLMQDVHPAGHIMHRALSL